MYNFCKKKIKKFKKYKKILKYSLKIERKYVFYNFF